MRYPVLVCVVVMAIGGCSSKRPLSSGEMFAVRAQQMDVVSKKLESKKSEFEACTKDMSEEQFPLRITLAWTITARNRVDSESFQVIEGTKKDSEIYKCLVERIQKINFKNKIGEDLNIEHPFVFYSPG